jgi:hypothetical protein
MHRYISDVCLPFPPPAVRPAGGCHHLSRTGRPPPPPPPPAAWAVRQPGPAGRPARLAAARPRAGRGAGFAGACEQSRSPRFGGGAESSRRARFRPARIGPAGRPSGRAGAAGGGRAGFERCGRGIRVGSESRRGLLGRGARAPCAEGGAGADGRAREARVSPPRPGREGQAWAVGQLGREAGPERRSFRRRRGAAGPSGDSD